MIETLAISVLIIAICVALMSIKLILRRNGKFSSQHIHDNVALRKRGICCAIEQDRQARMGSKNAIKERQ